jgi:hypothetical protein
MKRSSALSNSTLRSDLPMQFGLQQDGTLDILEAIGDQHGHGRFTRKKLPELAGRQVRNWCCVCSVPGLSAATSSPVRALDFKKLMIGRGNSFLIFCVYPMDLQSNRDERFSGDRSAGALDTSLTSIG